MTMDALVMAGGKGTRLQPLTFALPKPLLPVGERPILEIIIRQLRRLGFERVFVSVGHKGHLIKAYLSEVDIDGINISYLTEAEPLGTAGPLRMLPDDVDDVFMINGDILTRVDFAAVLRNHRASDGAALTVVVHHHEVPLPYGVLDLADDRIVAIREKPVMRFPVATGMYAVSRSVIDELPSQHTDMPDLINALAARGLVRAHVIDEFWTDLADLADYERINVDGDAWTDP